MILHCTEATELCFSVLPPLYTPFFNKWGQNAYYHYAPFSLDPFSLRTSSTSGSPVVLGPDCFFGFLTDEADGTFSYDGCGRLTVRCAPGQSLYHAEHCDPLAAWEGYNAEVRKAIPPEKEQSFWRGLEYCTWVDQKNKAVLAGSCNMWSKLNEQFVYDYMKRVEKLGLPRGKLTIDDGWDIRYAPDGRLMYGNWDVDRKKFPHMEKLVHDMAEEGFIPGLWFAPYTCTPNCRLAQQYPQLLGETFSENAEGEAVRRLMNLLPDEVLRPYYTDLFSRYIGMGFRKFKLDMSYGPKKDMKALLHLMHDIIKALDPTVEIEAHIPDIFISRWCDAVRINDVSFDPEGKWREVTMEHYKVCKYSAGGKLLNLDHVGTNTEVPEEEPFVEHAKMLLQLEGGYPTVSLLPDAFSPKGSDTLCGLIRDWVQRHPTAE